MVAQDSILFHNPLNILRTQKLSYQYLFPLFHSSKYSIFYMGLVVLDALSFQLTQVVHLSNSYSEILYLECS